MLSLTTFIIGLILIYYSSEWLIKMATQLGQILQWSNVAIGFIVIGIGTSMPEIAISLYSVLQQQDSMLLGNIVGSNISNCLLVFGIGLLTTSQSVLPRPHRTLTVYLSILTVFFSVGLFIGHLPQWFNALLLLIGLIAVWNLLQMKHEEPEKDVILKQRIGTLVLLIIFSMVLVLSSAKLIIDSGHTLAMMAGINEGLFAMLFIGVSNSLPEIAMVLVAMRQKKEGMVVGNIIGSNICNIAFGVGLSGLIKPLSAHIEHLTFVTTTLLLATFCFLLSCYIYRIKLRWVGMGFIFLFMGFYVTLFSL